LKLESIFNPASVAIIGASATPGKVGYILVKNMLKSGYGGRIYPVNSAGGQILGLKCYTSIREIQDSVDLAVISIPAAGVIQIAEECGEKRVKSLIIISAGFKETGKAGAELEAKLVTIAKRYDMRIQGPNCLGNVNTHCPLDLSFAAALPKKGSIGFISQSGALGTAVLDWIIKEEIGFASFISLGNKADLDEVDFIEAMAEDPNVKVILLYIESIERGRKFIEVASSVTRKKPIIVVKGGTSLAGSKAAGSHTGALVGSFLAYQKAFEKSGVILAETMEDLFNYAVAFVEQPLPKSEGIAIVTNAGGPGILATDLVEKLGLRLSEIKGETRERLKKGLPPAASVGNPIDILGDAPPDRYSYAIEEVLWDPDVHLVIVLLTPQAMTDSTATADSMVRLHEKHPTKSILAVFMGGDRISQATHHLKENGIPCFDFPEKGIKTVDALYRYSRYLQIPADNQARFIVETDRVKELFTVLRKDNRKVLLPTETTQVLRLYGVEAPPCLLAESPEQAIDHADSIGYPVVMKVVSPEILHKTDVGGVVLNVNNPDEVRAFFKLIMDRSRAAHPEAKIYGVSIDKMVPKGREMIIGMSRDPQFGAMVMAGLGGIYVNFLKDVSFGISPLSAREVDIMVKGTKSYTLLKGIRGEPAADISAFKEAILRISQLVWDFPEIVEMDINPILVYEEGHGCLALDVKITLN
jgi:acetyl coenzyme A synthetase (ADP forming)-like protein